MSVSRLSFERLAVAVSNIQPLPQVEQPFPLDRFSVAQARAL
jgi:hypothetical protein